MNARFSFTMTLLLLVCVSSASSIQWQFKVSGLPSPQIFRFPQNNHYYQAIPALDGIVWAEAKSQAESLSYFGFCGHLATISSKAENDFIVNNIGEPETLNRYWLGGFQPHDSAEPSGNWQWVTGEPWDYANWGTVEPDNDFSSEWGGAPMRFLENGEEALQLWENEGLWNDMKETSYEPGYVVEYEEHGVARSAPGDSMWLEPPLTVLEPGAKFNVTVWLNMSTPANSWQFYLIYNNATFNALRCDYTGIGKSLWSEAYPVDTVLPDFGFHNSTHGYVLHGEVLKSSANKAGAGSLAWIEFAWLGGPLATSELRLDVVGIFNSYAMDSYFNELPLSFGKASVAGEGPVAIFNYSPAEPKLNEPVVFNASASYVIGTGTISQYHWDFGDGTTTTLSEPIVSHTYTIAGMHRATLEVIDSEGRTDEADAYLYIGGPNSMRLEPATTVAEPGAKFNITVWLNVTAPANRWQFFLVYSRDCFSALRCNYTGIGKSLWSEAYPVYADVPEFGALNATHGYVLHGEVLASNDSKTGCGSLAWVEFEVTGVQPPATRELRLDVVSVFGSYVLDSHFNTLPISFGKASVTLEGPVATFSYSPAEPEPGEIVVFNASASYVMDSGAILEYDWHFGDGNALRSLEPAVNHTYAIAGMYNVTLEVTDSKGRTDDAYAYLYVGGMNSMWLEPALTVVVSGSKFNVTVWLNTLTPINSWQFFLVYNRNCLSALRCDYTGIGKSLWSEAYPVDTVAPAFNAHNATHGYVLHGEVLKSSANKAGAGSLAWIEFACLGRPPTTSQLRLDIVGVFSSYAMDSVFNELPLSFGKASVTLEGPVAIFSYSPAEPRLNEPLVLNASASYVAGIGTISQYHWDFGDGTTTTTSEPVVNHTYAAAGLYNVTLRVTDSMGRTDEALLQVNVYSPTIESCDLTGVAKNGFIEGEALFVRGRHFPAYSPLSLYLVNETSWSFGMLIPERVSGTATSVDADDRGFVPPTRVWSPPLRIGSYDIVVDMNGDGIYNDGDILYAHRVRVRSGGLVIPEVWLGSVLALVACFAGFALFGFFRRRTHESDPCRFQRVI